jgi:squalene-hopene/tetraprenyl-beta-curcumene cyclase
MRRATHHILSAQREDGHWCAELEGDTILESEYVLAMHFLGRTRDGRVAKAAEYIRRKQLPRGGWAIYPGGPPEPSASVKAYFVLKLVGDDPSAPHMVRARETILELGGVEACNSFTKLYLAIFGQYDWARCPAVPPEIILLPRWSYINIYEMSSWSRAILVPLSVVWAHKPACAVPERASIAELYTDRRFVPERGFWYTFFQGVDLCLKLLEGLPVKPSRRIAVKEAERWILERLEDSDGLGAIFPPIVNTIFALRCLGYSFDHPVVRRQIAELEKLEIEERDTLRVQPCFSPVWDTALAGNALIESGVPADDPAVLGAARWLLELRDTRPGDWKIKNPDGGKPGWFFEYANPYYPDNDSTAQVITFLTKVRFPDADEDSRRRESVWDAHRWHLTMQNRDGGWAAFDKGCDKEILTFVPFADHNAMIDPSTADITGRVLETLARLGYRSEFEPARRAVRYLLNEQEPDGSWFGRWGCNYVYGTWLALWGLAEIGEDPRRPWGRRAVRWLRAVQNRDGGWGESQASYEDPSRKGRGESTPSQTAWAVLALWAAGEGSSPAAARGIDWLLAAQRPDGGWDEGPWTGTGFPSVFYLKYHMYSQYFPLLALGTYHGRPARLDEPGRSARKPAIGGPATEISRA